MTTRKSYIPGDFQLRVGRSATGLGLYADSPIPKGACIIEYTGVEITKEQEEWVRKRYFRRHVDGKKLVLMHRGKHDNSYWDAGSTVEEFLNAFMAMFVNIDDNYGYYYLDA